MDLVWLFKGILIGISASAPLGPIGVLCVQRTLNKGRLSGFISGLGAALADTVYAIIAGMGLTIIINFIREQQLYFEIAGIALLFFLGFKIFYSNPAKQMRKSRRGESNLFEDFFSVSLLTISNPMALFLFLAVFAGLGLIKEDLDFYHTFQIVFGVLLGAAAWWFVLSTIVNKIRYKFRLKRLWWINKIAGAAIVLFGLASIIGMLFLD